MKCLIAALVVCCGAAIAIADEPAKPAKVQRPELRDELLKRTKVDQDARAALLEWSAKHGLLGDLKRQELDPERKAEFKKLSEDMEKATQENLGWLKELVERSGWPTVTMVGKDGAAAAWLLMQHADADPDFQRQCRDRMAKLPKDEVSPSDLELRDELLTRTKVDQDARLALIEWMKKQELGDGFDPKKLDPGPRAEFEKLSAEMEKADEENLAWLKNRVEQSGWPSVTMVGQDGAAAAWLLVQHADGEPKFQRKCLDLMTKLPKGEVSGSNLAYLTDRVLLAEGKKQLYGTQFHTVDGKMEPKPLEDEANVDRRRAEVGLGPLAEYAQQIVKVYGGRLK
jgi:hypothetical protein